MFVITAYSSNDTIYTTKECRKYHEMKDIIKHLTSSAGVKRIEVEHWL